MLRKDIGTRACGIAVFTKDSLKYEELPDIDDRKGVWCKLFSGKVHSLISEPRALEIFTSIS